MRKHNGMRPQDIAILLKIVALGNSHVQLTQLSKALFISLSEISESLNRSQVAKLIDFEKKNVHRQNLVEFLEHGVQYVFPQNPGAFVRGIPTAHAHPFMKNSFGSETNYVWADTEGKTLGYAIEPLYAKLTKAILEDDVLYKLLALVDVIRVGKVREINIAKAELRKIVLNELY